MHPVTRRIVPYFACNIFLMKNHRAKATGMHFLSNAISVVVPNSTWVLTRTLYSPVSDDRQPFIWRYDFEAVCNAPKAKSYPGYGGEPSKHGKPDWNSGPARLVRAQR